MTNASVFDYPAWNIDVLLTWRRRRAGVPNDDAATAQFRRQALIEIVQRAAGKLEISGRRCRLEFPNSIVLEGASREAIPHLEFIDSEIWPFRGVYVLTPRALGPVNTEVLTTLPANVREAIDAYHPFRWAQPGDQLRGWRDLMVDAEDARALWGGPIDAGASHENGPALKRGTDGQAVDAVKQYLKGAGGHPNIDDACAFVLKRFPKAGRDRVRDFYRQQTGRSAVNRGRPKIAKK